MRANPIPLMRDRLDMPVEGDDFGLDADLFHEFPGERGGESLAHLDPAAGQAEMADERRARPAYYEDPRISKHRRRDRKNWTRREQPVIHELSQAFVRQGKPNRLLDALRLVDWERDEKRLWTVASP